MQSAGQQCSCRALHRSGIKHLRPHPVLRRPVPSWAGRRQQACTCSAEQRHADSSRREALLAFVGAAAVALTPLPSSAEEETKTLYGRASPPTSYGGYGGNAKEAAKYTFEYPATWKLDTVNKQEKGMQGIDSRVFNTKIGKSLVQCQRNSMEQHKTATRPALNASYGLEQSAFVVTFGRAGEDKKFSKLGDVEQTLQGFAGADYDLNGAVISARASPAAYVQDALVSATDKKSSSRELDGQIFYDYEVAGEDLHYLASITLDSGKVFALFVKSPARTFATERPKLEKVIETFKIMK